MRTSTVIYSSGIGLVTFIFGLVTFIIGVPGYIDDIKTWKVWLTREGWTTWRYYAVYGGASIAVLPWIIYFSSWIIKRFPRATDADIKNHNRQSIGDRKNDTLTLSDISFAKELNKLLDEIERQIEGLDSIVPANHPMKHILPDSIGNSTVAEFHGRSSFSLEKIGHTLSIKDPDKFKKIEVAFRRYTHPWRPEEECIGVEFFKSTQELEGYSRDEMIMIAAFSDSAEKISPNELKKRLINLRDKVHAEFYGEFLQATNSL